MREMLTDYRRVFVKKQATGNLFGRGRQLDRPTVKLKPFDRIGPFLQNPLFPIRVFMPADELYIRLRAGLRSERQRRIRRCGFVN
jgi:hypothetical protein